MDFKWFIFFLLFLSFWCVCVFFALFYLLQLLPRHNYRCPQFHSFSFFPLIHSFSEFYNIHTLCQPFSWVLFFSTTRVFCLQLWNDEWINYAASQMHGNVLLLLFLQSHIETICASQSALWDLIVQLLNCFDFCQFAGWCCCSTDDHFYCHCYSANAGGQTPQFHLSSQNFNKFTYMKWNEINVNIVLK